MRSTFVDPELDAALDRDGYVVVRLLDDEGVTRLRTAYESLGVAPGDPQRACIDTFHCFDTQYKEAVHEEVEEVLAPAVQAIFDRYKSLSYCYIQKWPGDRSGFGLHQDISVLDETRYRSVEVWCALHDTNEENGQLWVVPGSHKWSPGAVRGIHSVPPVYRGLEERIISRHAIPVPVKAGDAIIFLHSTIHYSYANASTNYRLVAATDMIPTEAQHLHYVGNDAGGIDEYEIEESFWVEQNPFTLLRAPASLTKIGEVDPSAFVTLTDDDLDRFVEEGLAIEHEPLEVRPITPDLKWCHRCGTTDGIEGYVDRFFGNVTLLCPNCEAAQARMAGVLGDIDPDLLRRLDEDGYAVVDLLDADARERARQLVDQLGVDPAVDLFSMDRDGDRDTAVRTDLALRELVQPAIDRVLAGFRVFKSIPVIAGATGNNAVDLHQDWEHVDERYYRGYGVWCPLDGAGPDGGMAVIPGSHTWRPNHRGSGFPDPYAAIKDEIIRRGSTTLTLTPGQAVVYDNALLHHSHANTSGRSRVAISSSIAPPSAPVIHMHATGDGKAEVFEIAASDRHFTQQPFGSRPLSDVTRIVDITDEAVTLADLERWLPAGCTPSPTPTRPFATTAPERRASGTAAPLGVSTARGLVNRLRGLVRR